jgi:uncharacterized membrane protein YkoI
VVLVKTPDGAYKFGLGTDYGGEKFVSTVDGDGPACGVLFPDDVIDAINDVQCFELTHRETVNLIKNSGNEVKLSLVRDMSQQQQARRASMHTNPPTPQRAAGGAPTQQQQQQQQRQRQQQQQRAASGGGGGAGGGAAAAAAAKRKQSDSQKTLDAVTRLIQDNDVSPEDALKHAKMLSSVTVRKKGDAQRILLMNMVKMGNISIEDAMKHVAEHSITLTEEAKPVALPKGVWLKKKVGRRSTPFP